MEATGLEQWVGWGCGLRGRTRRSAGATATGGSCSDHRTTRSLEWFSPDEALRAVLARATAGELALSDPVARRELCDWELVHPDPVRPGIVHLTAEGILFLDAD
jgi:hypothetical protein